MKFKDGTKFGIELQKYRSGTGTRPFGILFHRNKWEVYGFETDDSSFCTECFLAIYLFVCEIHIGRFYK